MKEEYHFKRTYKILSLVYALVGALVIGFLFWIKSPIVMGPTILIIWSVSIRNKRTNNPYMEIDDKEVFFSLAWGKEEYVELNDIKKVQIIKDRQLLFYRKGSRSILIDLNLLTVADKKRALVEIPAIINGETLRDLSKHLVEN